MSLMEDFKKMCRDAKQHNDWLSEQDSYDEHYNKIKEILYKKWNEYVNDCINNGKYIKPVMYIPVSTDMLQLDKLPYKIDVFTLDGVYHGPFLSTLKVLVDMDV